MTSTGSSTWKHCHTQLSSDKLVTVQLISLCRDIYVSTMQPQSKHIVLLIDHGNSLSPTQIHMAKSIAKHLIASFTENDRVSHISEMFCSVFTCSDVTCSIVVCVWTSLWSWDCGANVSSNPAKTACCFLKQETFSLMLRTGWSQEMEFKKTGYDFWSQSS